MSFERYSVGLGGRTADALRDHLARPDGQEDLCFATWRPSTGKQRRSALLVDPILPTEGERSVHGNASFESRYALRAAKLAARRDSGLVFMHCHPQGIGWQRLNDTDRRAEASIANLAREMTGLPLVGMTLAGSDGSWGARVWDRGRGTGVGCTECESVRVITDRLSMTFNDDLRTRPRPQPTQIRTVHAWGDAVQEDLARLRILVAGAGSVGMQLVESLARTGIEHIGVMDFDRVEPVNLDRITGAGRIDALLRRPKIEVARRILRQASTAEHPIHELFQSSVCEPSGLERLLDFDVIFSCVDRPWPRHVLNTIAYADLIPVIDGGLRLERHSQAGLRNAYWRSQVVTTGRSCLACIGQYDPGDVQLERDGSLDDPEYIAGLPANNHLRANQNVSALSLAVASAMLNQFLSLVVAPSGIGDPGPQHFSLATHRVEAVDVECADRCPYALSVGEGDLRVNPTGDHAAADRHRNIDSLYTVFIRRLVDGIESGSSKMSAALAQTLQRRH